MGFNLIEVYDSGKPFVVVGSSCNACESFKKAVKNANDDSVIYFNVDDLNKDEITFISSLKITQIPTAVKKVNGSGVTLKIKSYEEYKSWAAC